MKILKNKFFITLLCAALAVTLSATALSVLGIGTPVRNIFVTVTTPVRWCASKIAGGFRGFSTYFAQVERLDAENKELREENEKLKKELADAAERLREDELLREYLSVAEFSEKQKIMAATVIGREVGNYRTTYTLNRGSLHGIKVGMPVLTPTGVVGSVTEVGLGYCCVTSIVETTSSVGVYDKATGASGLLCGTPTLRADSLCSMKNIDPNSEISVGDVIVTAGTGRIYPAGIPVGEVTAIEPDAISRTLTATVRPFADFSGLSSVLILTSYEIVPYDAGEEAVSE